MHAEEPYMRLHESLRGTMNRALTWTLVAGLGLLVTLPSVGVAQQLGALPQLEPGREMGGIIDRVLETLAQYSRR